MNSSDGDGISWRDLQMQRLNAQNVAEQMVKVSEEAEKKKPQCPHCGGRLPGKFELCAYCNRQLYWGHVSTLSPFKTSTEAQHDIAAVNQALKEAAAARERKQVEFQAMCNQHGMIIGFLPLGVILTLCGMAFAAYYSQSNVFLPDSVRVARLWQAFAVMCCGIASVLGLAFSPFVMMLVFFVGAAFMGFLRMPMWICAIPVVVGVSELFARGDGGPSASARGVEKGEWERKYREALESPKSRSGLRKQPPVQHQPDGHGLQGTTRAEPSARLPSLTCPRCKGDIPMPSLTALNITCPTCGGVFKTKRQKSAEA